MITSAEMVEMDKENERLGFSPAARGALLTVQIQTLILKRGYEILTGEKLKWDGKQWQKVGR